MITKEGNEYVRRYTIGGETTTQWRDSCVAIAFERIDDETTMLHKIGPASLVEKWLDAVQFKCDRHGIVNQIQVVSSDKWDTEELNRIIDRTGYIHVVLKKHGLI